MPKYTTKQIADYFESEGCELLDEYRGVFEKMKYRCHCGELATTTWNNFKYGKRCGNCTKWGQKKKRSLEEVQKLFSERGCEFLDDEFKGIHHKHNYRCKCGREDQITLAGFHHQNQYCRECGLEKNKKEGHHAWIEDRDEARRNLLFRKKCNKALRSTLKAVGQDKVGRTTELLGYGPKQLQEHIENHPNWNRVKEGNWHLDHIFPIQAFIENDIRDIRLINHLDNLRPITQRENNVKHAKYDKRAFKKWLKDHT